MAVKVVAIAIASVVASGDDDIGEHLMPILSGTMMKVSRPSAIPDKSRPGGAKPPGSL
ncbi:hypothetical protein [Aureimonas sp. SA4125]|uniref:hypothetical protein n=1 Tax=Aureimonas sp. SA4125 TaxID=2826993 RepID=UPI001CC3EEE8|nr:hypothetical protein [Aureimonas sp. SA4125]